MDRAEIPRKFQQLTVSMRYRTESFPRVFCISRKYTLSEKRRSFFANLNLFCFDFHNKRNTKSSGIKYITIRILNQYYWFILLSWHFFVDRFHCAHWIFYEMEQNDWYRSTVEYKQKKNWNGYSRERERERETDWMN